VKKLDTFKGKSNQNIVILKTEIVIINDSYFSMILKLSYFVKETFAYSVSFCSYLFKKQIIFMEFDQMNDLFFNETTSTE
jgi:hypothetical protein